MGMGYVSIELLPTEIEILLAALGHYEQRHQSEMPQSLADNIRELRGKLADAVD